MRSKKWESAQKRRKEMGKRSGALQENQSWHGFALMALGAASLLTFAHWFNGKPGRRLGGGYGDQGRQASGNGNNDDNVSNAIRSWDPQSSDPTNLAELRVQRAKAAEKRLQHRRNDPSTSSLTPLGMILALTQKVTNLEDETLSFLSSIKAGTANAMDKKEQERLIELLSNLQLEVDCVEADEVVKPYRKMQTNRIQTLITQWKYNKLDNQNQNAANGDKNWPSNVRGKALEG